MKGFVFISIMLIIIFVGGAMLLSTASQEQEDMLNKTSSTGIDNISNQTGNMVDGVVSAFIFLITGLVLVIGVLCLLVFLVYLWGG